MPLRIGFTGTREGMSEAQERQLRYTLQFVLSVSGSPEFHYGEHDKVELKADRVAARIAHSLGYVLREWPASTGTELARDRAEVAAVNL